MILPYITHFQTYPRALGPLSMWGVKSMAFGCVEFILLGTFGAWNGINDRLSIEVSTAPLSRQKKTSQKKNWHSWCVEDFCWGSMFDFFRVELAEVPRQDPWRPRVPRVPTHAPEVWNSLFASASDVEKNPWDSCFAKENYGKWSTNDGSTSMPHPIAGNYIWNRLKNMEKKLVRHLHVLVSSGIQNSRPRPFLDNITSLPCYRQKKGVHLGENS